MPQAHAGHFESLEVQNHAARLGMWVFLTSEMLLFAGLFALFAATRAHDPAGFHHEVLLNNKALGSTNTAVLLVSSTTAALGARAMREGRRAWAFRWLIVTGALGIAFLAIKLVEYAGHIRDGILPGGLGAHFASGVAAHAPFWTLYYVMTGLHAVHVAVGIVVLGVTALRIASRQIDVDHAYRVELGVLYWHLIDLVWIFLWPLLYLA